MAGVQYQITVYMKKRKKGRPTEDIAEVQSPLHAKGSDIE